MTAALFSLFLTAILIGSGWSLVRFLDASNQLTTGERVVAAFVTGLVLLYFSVYAVGFWRLDAVSMAWVGLALAILSLPAALQILPHRIPAVFREIFPWRTDKRQCLLLLGVAAVAASGLLQGLAPPNDYDSLLYHLAIPKYDLERGFIGFPWNHALSQAFHPELTRNLTRFSMAFVGADAAQMMHGVITVAGAAGSSMLARRMGLSASAAALSALLFLATRVVVWQMATVETDVAAASFAAIAFCIYLAWRESRTVALGILFGIVLGAALVTKLYAFVFALALGGLILSDVLRGRLPIFTASIGPLFSLLVYLPHGIRTYRLTGNPVYPVLNTMFNPGKPNPLRLEDIEMGVGRGLADFLLSPWNLSVHPTEYFDGMVLGAPIFLAFLPMVFVARRQFSHLGAMVVVAGVYFVGWFWLLGQHVRYLLPVLPLVCAMTAGGLVFVWDEAARARFARVGLSAVVGVLAVTQLMFVAIYAAIRLPVSLGLMTPDTYHSRTPTLGGAFYDTCNFITEHLEPNERVISLLTPHSYYCPQARAILTTFDEDSRWWLNSDHAPRLSPAEFLAHMERANVRFVVIQARYEDRTTNIARSPVTTEINLAGRPFGNVLAAPLQTLEPVFENPLTRVYDGRQVLEMLRSPPKL